LASPLEAKGASVKEHLLQTVLPEPVERRANLAREYLQIYLLRLLHEIGAMSELAFVGGTALRILYRLARFSEDLGFSYAPSEHGRSAFKANESFQALQRELMKAGYVIQMKASTKKNVVSAFYRFDGLPRQIGWSDDPRLALSIKLEVDLSPPAGAHVETTLIQRFFPVAIRHNDLPSLFAGKLHAILARPYAKGRDWYDLVWYLTSQHGLEPNLELLGNALQQTGHKIQAGKWREAVAQRLRSLKWSSVLADLRPFLERQSDLNMLQPELILKLVTEGT
jgi:hypothetical protein